jgi:AcrR family transcriptional regulator
VTREKLQARKQQVVRDAIHDAAIELFAAKGFDQTTVDEVAEAAGISRRSFFHYYASKDDLLAQGIVEYAHALVEAVKSCPPGLTAFEVLRETVFAGIKYVAEQPHLHKIIEISDASAAARRAYGSRSVEVDESLTAAYAQRLRNTPRSGLESLLLAQLTLSVMRVSIAGWFKGEYQDLSTAAKHGLSSLTRLIGEGARSTHSRSNTSKRLSKLSNSQATLKLHSRAGRKADA